MTKHSTTEYPVADPEKIPGDAPLELKRTVVEMWPFHEADPDHFASSIGARIELVEISIVPKREDPQAMEARVVAEIDVVPGAFLTFECKTVHRAHGAFTPGMTNHISFTHGGCIAYLADL